MALYFIFAITALGCLLAVQDWRKGLFVAVIVGNFLDPLRKMVPGAPGYLVMLTFAVVACAAIGMLLDRTRFRYQPRQQVIPIVRAVAVFFILIIPACFISATYGANSWMFTILGILSYGVIFVSIFIGYYFAKEPADIHKLLAFYCIVSSVFLTGGWIEYLGLFSGWSAIGTDALGTEWIRYSDDLIIDLIAGFHRSPDVMGWHAATVVMFSVILAVTAKPGKRLIWFLTGLFAFSVLLLCGRRKMVFMIPLFLISGAAILIYIGRGRSVLTMIPVLLVGALSIYLAGSVVGQDSEQIRYYNESRSQAAEQLQTQGFKTALTTVQQVGFLGKGIGFATPGAHNIPGERPYTWQESGTSRVLAELGIPGAIGVVAVCIMLLAHCMTVVRRRFKLTPSYGWYPLGLLAFFIANLGSLVVSGQILADPFIALMLGFSGGAVLAFTDMRVPGRRPQPVAAT